MLLSAALGYVASKTNWRQADGPAEDMERGVMGWPDGPPQCGLHDGTKGLPTFAAANDALRASHCYLEFQVISRERARDARIFLAFLFSKSTGLLVPKPACKRNWP